VLFTTAALTSRQVTAKSARRSDVVDFPGEGGRGAVMMSVYGEKACSGSEEQKEQCHLWPDVVGPQVAVHMQWNRWNGWHRCHRWDGQYSDDRNSWTGRGTDDGTGGASRRGGGVGSGRKEVLFARQDIRSGFRGWCPQVLQRCYQSVLLL
jgi:hypothetical protein